MATKSGKLVTYHEELPLIKLLDPSNHVVLISNLKFKYFISPLELDQWPSNMGIW